MYKIKGNLHNFNGKQIFLISKKMKLTELFDSSTIKVCVNDLPFFKNKEFITSKSISTDITKTMFVSDVNIKYIMDFNDGDIIFISPNGDITKLWEANSKDNLLFLTDYCNSKCIMCPQTEVKNIRHYYEQSLKVLNLIKDVPQDVCLSGGEPTFLKEEYLKVVRKIKEKFPKIFLYVLTNGKNFSDFQFLKQCVVTSPVCTTYAIPIYSSNTNKHDYIVGNRGSFKKTINGIYNLYKFKQNIEIRIVITKLNYKNLLELSHFIYWNLPFVNHIAFIGMETHGSAMKNFNTIWIEPLEYIDNLKEAIEYLDERNMNISIFNLPFCILPMNLHKFARDSISNWKKYFLPECDNCELKSSCSGFFSTSCNVPKGIKPIKNNR